MHKVDVRLLGGFCAVVDGVPLATEAFATRRAADLVKLLALAPAHRLPRDAVVEALWPHLAPEAGLANLHKAAHHARRALGFSGAVVLAGGAVALAPEATVTTDVERFEAGDDETYGGDLLPDDRYEEWTVHERQRLHDRRVERLRHEGRWSALLALEPADEHAHRELMREAAARGDLAAVVRQFGALRDELARLGLAPAAATRELYAELRDGPAVQPPPVVRTPPVGRQRELAAALGALDAAGEGRGGGLLISGDAGIGKTHLTDVLVGEAAGRGWHVLRAAPREPQARAAYRPIAEALEPLMTDRPDLAGRLSEHVQASLAVLQGRGGTARGQDILVAVARLVTTAAREHGLLLVLEDLHWTDDASVRLLRHLVPAAQGERLLVVLTTRHEGGGPVAELRRALLAHATATIVLGPLPDAAMRELVTAERPLPAAAVTRIVARAAGNPFYARELAAGDASADVPSRLQDLLDVRLAAVAPDLLAALAVLEDGSSTGDIAQLAGRATTADELEAAARAGVIERFGSGWRFCHALLREAACRSLPAPRLRDAHARAAAQLLRAGAAPERVAAHLLESGRGREAVPLLRQAAAGAVAVGAYADGRRYVETALAHGGDEERPALLELLGDVLHGLGDARAPGAYRRAAAVAPDRRAALAVKEARALIAVGDLDGAERAVAAAGGAAGATTVRGLLAWYRGDVVTAQAHVDAAAEVDPDGIEVLTLQALVRHADGGWDRSMALRLADVWNGDGVLDQVVGAYMCVTEYLLHTGEHTARLVDFARGLRERALAARSPRSMAFSAIVLGEAELLDGDAEAAVPLLRESLSSSQAGGCCAGEAMARLKLGEALAALGEHRGARVQLEESAELAHASSLSAHMLYLAHAALVRTADDPQEALRRVDRAEPLLEPSPCRFCPPDFFTAAAIACARAGEVERARAYLERARSSVAGWSRAPRAAAVTEAYGEVLLAERRVEDAEVAFLRAAEGYAAIGHRLHEERMRRMVPLGV